MGLRWPDLFGSPVLALSRGKPAPTGPLQDLWAKQVTDPGGAGLPRERAISCKKILNLKPNASGWQARGIILRLVSDAV